MGKFTKIDALLLGCAGAAALMIGAPALAQEEQATPAAAATEADDDMTTPDDAASADATPEEVNSDAPDPVLSNEGEAAAPAS